MWVSRRRLGSIVGIQSKHTSLMPEIRYDIPNPVCNKSIPTHNPYNPEAKINPADSGLVRDFTAFTSNKSKL